MLILVEEEEEEVRLVEDEEIGGGEESWKDVAQPISSSTCAYASSSIPLSSSMWIPTIILIPCSSAALPTVCRALQSEAWSRMLVKPWAEMEAMSDRMVEAGLQDEEAV